MDQSIFGDYQSENPNNKYRQNARGRSRGRGKDRGGGAVGGGRGRGRGRGAYYDNDKNEVGGSSFFDHDKSEVSEKPLNSNQGYNFMAELESYKACKTQERRQGSKDGSQGRARSMSSERSTSSFKSTNNPKFRNQEYSKHDGSRTGDTYPIDKWKQMVLKMALLLNVSAEETNTDCYFFYYSTCSKNTECPFRHEPAALQSKNTCNYWREGKCYKKLCTYRHMEMEKKQPVHVHVQRPDQRPETMCWFENQPGGCQKQDCPFKHQSNYGQDEEYMEEEDDGSNVPGGNANRSTSSNQGETVLDKKVGNFLEMFRQTLTSPNKEGESSVKLEAGEIADDKGPYFKNKNGSMLSTSLLGSPPSLEPLDPAVEAIRKRLMEPPGIERRVEEFLAAVRFTIAPPLMQQPGLRKSLADRLTFTKKIPQTLPPVLPPALPQTLSVTEMKNRINSLKDNQQQQQQQQQQVQQQFSDSGRIVYEREFLLQLQFCQLACIKPANLAKCLTRKSLPLQVVQQNTANRGRGRGWRENYIRDTIGLGRGGKQLGSQVNWEKERDTFESQAQPNVEKEYGKGRGNLGEGRVSGNSAIEGRAYSNEREIGQDNEKILKEGFEGFTGEEIGTGYVKLEHEKEGMGNEGTVETLDKDKMGHSDLSRVPDKGQGPLKSSSKGAPDEKKITSDEVPSTHGRDKEHGLASNIKAPIKVEINSSSEMDSQNKNKDKIIDEKTSVPKPLGEKQPLSDILCDQKKISETPDKKLLVEKKPLLEISKKDGKKAVLPVNESIFNMIFSARVEQQTSDKNLKPSKKPDGVGDRKVDLLSGAIDDKKGDHLPETIANKKGDLLTGKIDNKKYDPLSEKMDDKKCDILPEKIDAKKGDLLPEKIDAKKGDLLLEKMDAKKSDFLPKKGDILVEKIDAKKGDLLPKTMDNKKGDILPKTIDTKKHLGIDPTQSSRRDTLDNVPQYLDPREQWLQEENRRNERLNWNAEERWYDDRRDMKYDSPDKYMAQSSSGRTEYDRRWSPERGDSSYDYGHRSDSYRDRGGQDEYRDNYAQDWDPISRQSRDWRYNRSYDQDWGDERGPDLAWKEERDSSRIWDDRRERSPSRERGILGAAPEAEEGILGAPPKDDFDRFSDKISAKKKDWNYDYDYDGDKETREWGPSGKTRDNLSEVGPRQQWNESYSRQEWDSNADQRPRDWSPGRFPERDDIRNWGPGTVSESFRSSERDLSRSSERDLSRSSERDLRAKDLPPIRSPGWEDTSKLRLDGRSPGIGKFAGEQPSPGRQALSRGRSPLTSSEIRTRSPHRSFAQKLPPTSTLSKTERSLSPNSSGRNATSEASTPVSTFGQQKNKSQMAICVKNLPSWTDEQSLKNVLSFEYKKYGQVTRVDVNGTPATERYAVICFRKPHEAQEAVFDSRNKVIFGQSVEVSLFDGDLSLEEPKVYTAKSDYDYKKLLVGYKGEEYDALRSVLEVFKRECQKYREQPSTHPQYNEEYHAFCIEKQSKILSLGGDPTQYDILPEWKAYWPRRLEELFGVSWQTMKKQCLGSLANKKEIASKKLSSSSSSASKKNRRSPSPRSDKSSRRKHRDRSSHSKSHVSSSHHREKSRSRRRRSSSRSSTESSSTPRRDRHKERHTDKHKKSRRKRERSSSHSSSSNERSESKKKSPKKKDKKELPSEDPMEDGEIREDVESDVSKLTSTKKIGGDAQKDSTLSSTKKYGGDTQKENYQEFIKQRMSDVLGHVPEVETNKSTKLDDKDEKPRKKKSSKFPNEIYPYTLDGSPKVRKSYGESKMSRLVPYEAEDDHEQTLNKRGNMKGGGALGALMAQYSEPASSSAAASSSHSASNIAISPLKVCGNIIQMIDILGVTDDTISSVGQPLKDLYKQAMSVEGGGSDSTEVFRDGKATVNLTSCKLAILAESGTISKSNRKLYQEVLENMDKLMKVDQHFVEGINIERISKKTLDMDVSEAIHSIRKELLRINPTANVGEDRVMNLYMEIKKRHLMYSLHNYHDK